MKKYLVIFIVITVFYYFYKYCVQSNTDNFADNLGESNTILVDLSGNFISAPQAALPQALPSLVTASPSFVSDISTNFINPTLFTPPPPPPSFVSDISTNFINPTLFTPPPPSFVSDISTNFINPTLFTPTSTLTPTPTATPTLVSDISTNFINPERKTEEPSITVLRRNILSTVDLGQLSQTALTEATSAVATAKQTPTREILKIAITKIETTRELLYQELQLSADVQSRAEQPGIEPIFKDTILKLREDAQNKQLSLTPLLQELGTLLIAQPYIKDNIELFNIIIDQKYDKNAILSDAILMDTLKYTNETFDSKLSNYELEIIYRYVKYTRNDPSVTNTIVNMKELVLNKRFPIGVIMAWNFESIPNGWAICDGTKGTPDLRGRFILSTDRRKDKRGKIKKELKEKGGAESVTLTIKQLPKHKHSWEAYNDNYDEFHKYKSNIINKNYETSTFYGLTDDNNNRKREINTNDQGGIIEDKKGRTKPYETMPPFYVLTYIMKIK